MLRQHPCHHAGQNIPGPASCHAGISCGIHPRLAVRVDDQRSMSFEHDNHFMLMRKFARHAQPVFLHIGDAAFRPAAPSPPDAA